MTPADPGFVIVAVGLALTVAGALGVAYAVFRTNVVQRTIELYKAENELLGKTVARLERDAGALAERAAALESANRVLQTTVSGEAAVKAAAVEIAKDHAEARAIIVEVANGVRVLLAHAHDQEEERRGR